MRRILVALMIGLVWICTSPSPLAAQNVKVEKQQMKARHKAEKKTLKMREKYQKQMMKDQRVSKSVRIQMKHQLERERRELRERHKDEMQDLKDRQRTIKEYQARQ
jgi:hypothetical protein